MPELIQEPAFDVSSQDSDAVNAFRTVDDKNPEAVRKDLELVSVSSPAPISLFRY